MMGHDWITWLAAIIALCFCAYIMGKEDGQKEGGGLSEEAWIEIEKYEIDKKYELYEKMANEQKDPAIRKPMTLEELHALIDSGEEAVIYCETEDDAANLYGTILYGGRIYDRYGEAPSPDHIRYETYGKTWRAWASRPTDEERQAAPWEDEDDADL